MIIRDPLSQEGARVTDEGKLTTEATCVPQSHYVNHHEEEYYTLTISQQATAADDCIGYIKNNGGKDLVLESFYLYSTTATLLTVKVGDAGTPNSPTVITPVNCHAGSGNAAEGTFYKGADLDNAGANLAGGVDVLPSLSCEAGKGVWYEFLPTIILPKNKTATFYVNHNTSAVIIVVGMNYHSEPF